MRASRPELADLRRQLEGGLEVLEACSTRYRELSAVLQRRDWKEQLRQTPGLLELVRGEEAPWGTVPSWEAHHSTSGGCSSTGAGSDADGERTIPPLRAGS